MKIKRYMAANMRQALRSVRESQGPDAVILSSERVNGGFEVIAAVDYDESLMHQAMGVPGMDNKPPARRQDLAVDDQPAAAKPPASIPERDSAPKDHIVWSQDPTLIGIQRQLTGVKALLENQLASLAWNEMQRASPQRAQLMRTLSMAGLRPDVVKSLCERLREPGDGPDAQHRVVKLLSSSIRVADADPADSAGVIAVVGATGVGKTTTIAKLAARAALRYGVDQIGLVTTDSYRIGAQEQLLSFGRILGVPVNVAYSRNELTEVLESLHGKRLVLVDTAGVARRDLRFIEQLASLRATQPSLKLFLALAANSQYAALAETVATFASMEPDGCIATKLDEAGSLGGLLSALIPRQLSLAFITDGQRVPEDIHLGSSRRLWLAKRALTLSANDSAPIDDTFIAEKLTEVAQHAYA